MIEMNEAVVISAITTIGGIIIAYLKLQGDRRERLLKSEADSSAAAISEAARTREAQAKFNEAAALALARIESKLSSMTGESTEHQLHGIASKADEIDRKSNLILTNTEVIKSRGSHGGI